AHHRAAFHRAAAHATPHLPIRAGVTKRARVKTAKKGLVSGKRLLAATPKSQSFSTHLKRHGKSDTKHTSPPGRTQVQNDPTVLNPPQGSGQGASTGATGKNGTDGTSTN
ncbi:MAG: hypothetical protein JO023_05945, partial [Chloroflexi bacterium]|nr:hypothetical protein [Chloroflexota bacterium]